jgi:DNA-binding CsgD family transcriptional regulator
MWMEVFDWRRAAAEIEPALTLARLSGSRTLTNVAANWLAKLRVSVGELDQAAAMLNTIVPDDQPGPTIVQCMGWLTLAELALARGEPERCLTLLDRLVGSGDMPRPEDRVPLLLKLRGVALARLCRLDAAEVVLLAARDSATVLGYRPLRWRIDAALGALFLTTGRLAEAETACQRARATIDELAATIGDAAVREHFRGQALARLPARASHEPRPAAVARLTPRQVEVLRLLADGRSDREIAGALAISPRTVMHHVTAILNALGVASRTAAAALAIRQRIV